MTDNKHSSRSLFVNTKIVMPDIENNTFVEIVISSYCTCTRRRIDSGDYSVPHLYEINDECLEFLMDNNIKTVTWNGIRMSAMTALDLYLIEVMKEAGLIFEYNKQIINPFQILMFEDLYD